MPVISPNNFISVFQVHSTAFAHLSFSHLILSTVSRNIFRRAATIRLTHVQIIVPLAVCGLIIITLLLTMFLQFKKSRKNSNPDLSNVVETPQHPQNNEYIQIPLDSTTGRIEMNIPPSKPENEMAKEFAKLETAIKNFVQSYFGQGNSTKDAEIRVRSIINNLTSINVPKLPSTEKLAELLLDPSHRSYGLRLVIAAMIFYRTDYEKPVLPDVSLMPSGIALMLQTMKQGTIRDPYHSAFKMKWRVLTSYLTKHTEIFEDQQLLQNIDKVIVDIDNLIGVFASPRFSDQERRNSLESIVRKAIEFKLMLFSQPAVWKLAWPDNLGGVVIFPGLRRLTKDNGNIIVSDNVRIREPKVFIQ